MNRSITYSSNQYIQKCGGKNTFFSIQNKDFARTQTWPFLYIPDDGIVIHQDIGSITKFLTTNTKIIVMSLPPDAIVTDADGRGDICYADRAIVHEVYSGVLPHY